MPGWGRKTTIVYIVVILILFLLPLAGLSIYYIHILNGLFIFIIAASSLRLINLSGQGSLGHAGFMSIGAYTSGIMAKHLDWTPWLTIPLGILFTLVIAFIMGIPFSRLRGIYFAMISLFFGMGLLAINQLFNDITGGYSGTGGIPPLFSGSKIPYYYLFLSF